MPKYRKKPVEIEAIQIKEDASNAQEIEAFFGEFKDWYFIKGGVVIRTLEGDHRADLGHWIIRGVKGEFYPCKPDIFELTYEQVDE